MSDTIHLPLSTIEATATAALMASNVSAQNAVSVAKSIAAAERDGQPSVGLSYLPTYCDHAACGKVDGHAIADLTLPSLVTVRVDAKTGFAHPALAKGLPALCAAARRHGVGVLGVGNSYACGSLGYFVEELAGDGLIALMMANASPSMVAYGGRSPFFGTNPLAFSIPSRGRDPLVIDQSTSVVAMVAVLDAHRRGVPLPPGWALNGDGLPTLDAEAGIAGSLCAIGGYKGMNLALLVDVLAAGLTGSHFSFEASSFGDCEGGPPRTGQLLIAIDPHALEASFTDRIETFFGALQSATGDRLPGQRRLEARQRHQGGVEVPVDVWTVVERYATRSH